MGRAIVLIGVSKTANPGKFPELPGVEDAIRRMRAWAEKQKFDAIEELTEKTVGSVTALLINDTIDEIVRKDSSLTQLVIYFSGHGIVNASNEYWLLSRAPVNGNEAVNVSGSIALAESGQIPHVVFISDACRSQADTVQIGRVTGSAITPNVPNSDTSQFVDVFYAARLGAPAVELKHGKSYVAVFTLVLEMAIGGGVPSLIDRGFVRPRPLGDWLKDKVPKAVARLQPSGDLSQSPEARICSPPEAWISQFQTPSGPAEEFEAAQYISDPLFMIDLGPQGFSGNKQRPAVRKATSLAAANLLKSLVRKISYAKVVNGRANACIAVIGSELQGATLPVANPQIVRQGDSEVLSVWVEKRSQALLELADGIGILVPVLLGYVAIVSVGDGVVDDIHYEPLSASGLNKSRESLMYARSWIYRSIADGELSLDEEMSVRVCNGIISSKYKDPALSACAAYAIQGPRRRELIRGLYQHMTHDDAATYDLAMLAGELSTDRMDSLSLGLPLLARGWALKDVLAPSPSGAMAGVRGDSKNSLWSCYDYSDVLTIRERLIDGGYHRTSLSGDV